MLKNEYNLNTLLGACATGFSAVWFSLGLFIMLTDNIEGSYDNLILMIFILIGVSGLVIGAGMLLRKGWAPLMGQVVLLLALLAWVVLWGSAMTASFSHRSLVASIGLALMGSVIILFGIFILGNPAILRYYADDLTFGGKNPDILDDL